MKKIKPLLILFTCLSLCGCSEDLANLSPEEQLQRLDSAMKEVNSSSFTIEMDQNICITINGQSQKSSLVGFSQVDSDEMYSKVSITLDDETQEQETYAKIDGDEVIVWYKSGFQWEKQAMSIESYDNSQLPTSDLDTNDVFTYNEGVFSADVEALNEQMNAYFDSCGESYGGTCSGQVSKYDITIEKRKLKTIECDLVMEISILGTSIRLSEQMKYTYSKIGKTKVNVPKDLPNA
ncbi:MAG: hypothetical protein ACI311_05650 [Bacilli bacterium]